MIGLFEEGNLLMLEAVTGHLQGLRITPFALSKRPSLLTSVLYFFCPRNELACITSPSKDYLNEKPREKEGLLRLITGCQ
ncbi:uncharacterized protein LOC131144247 isoform X2 [Malania oleifera]|uniref:uncharacterized protein LOC131144247 isoform X2 n=1 Tax=Malania oleifera TaxID=397392 RepID=UPI0025ADC9C8|nr:uncharacterized protein LOC131144247 isoform X2 [Malania oleifera]